MSFFELLAWCAAAAVLGAALRGAAWRQLADRESAVVLAAVLAVLLAMRLAIVSLLPGMQLHFIGAAIATLMFGWHFAVIALALATLGAAAIGGSAWIGVAWEFVIGAALPVAGVWWLLAATRKWLPRNPFVYIFAAAFAGGALSMLLAQCGKALVLLSFALGSTDAVTLNYLLTLPAMMFAEAFFSGGTLAVLAVYRPQWVATFDDRFYLSDDVPP